MYIITDYTKKKAKELGVDVKKSTNPKKKIDVFKNGEKIASVVKQIIVSFSFN